MLYFRLAFIAAVCAAAYTTPTWADTPVTPAANPQKPFRAPATPLIACDPYFSVWSPASKLTDADTTHWTGKPHRLTSLVSINGEVYRLIGREPAQIPALNQTACAIAPTQTRCQFSGAGIE